MSDAEFQTIFNRTPCYSCNEVILITGTIMLLLVLIAEFIDWGVVVNKYVASICDKAALDKPCIDYGYEDNNGPSVWKLTYPAALGYKQSPINIVSKYALVCPTTPLRWSNEYTTIPNCIQIYNDGHCVTLEMIHPRYKPSISGSILKSDYELDCIKFRWGPTDDEGTEHTIDYKRFAMEIQAIHQKIGYKCETQFSDSKNSDNTLVVSYILQATAIENPYLEPVVQALRHIRHPGTSTCVDPFPICWLLPAFASDYYMYYGSLTHPPCSEGVQWLVQPETIAVAPRQIRKFRKLISNCKTSLLSNTRPIQCINNRHVFYYTTDYCAKSQNP